MKILRLSDNILSNQNHVSKLAINLLDIYLNTANSFEIKKFRNLFLTEESWQYYMSIK